MTDYSKSKIYRIRCNLTNQCYIGSTTQVLSTRIAMHKASHKQYQQGKSGRSTAYQILERDDYQVELIEPFPCDNKHDLHYRERYWIQHTENCVNKNIPLRDAAEYYTDNRQARLLYQREHYEANKPAIKERMKLYYLSKKGQSK